MAVTLAEINSQIQEHDQRIAQLRKQAEELRSQERAGVIEQIRRQIADYGITASDLRLSGGRAGAKRSVSVAAPAKSVAKYRSPTGETWSGGRGRKPRWVVEALAAGKSLADFEIK